MNVLLNELEQEWLDAFEKVNQQKPSSLKLILDREGDGDISIATLPHKEFTKSNLAWISKLKTCLTQFPDFPGFWLLSNIDGWNVGKGSPSFFSGTTVGEGGATGSLRENFYEFYHLSVEIDYGEFGEDFYAECDCETIKSNLGDLKIQNVRVN